jgi:RNA polymerase sigma-70 factor (ECF subfamily)
MDATEQYHLIQLTQGNKESFVFLHRRYQSRIYRYCYQFVRNEEAAQEITSDVFVKIWEKRAGIRIEQAIAGLLFKITRDLSLSYLRKVARDAALRKAYIEDYFESLTNPIEDEIFIREGLQIANQAIASLPPKCRLVFRLRYFSGLSLQQIAEELNISTNTVQNHLSKGTRIVKTHLQANSDLVFLVFLHQLI